MFHCNESRCFVSLMNKIGKSLVKKPKQERFARVIVLFINRTVYKS